MGTLGEDQSKFLIISHSVLRLRSVSGRTFREIKMHILCSLTPPPRKSCLYEMWKNIINDSMAHAVHDHPLYLECPDMLCTVGETSYGIWVGFVVTDIVFTIILIIYLLVKPHSLYSRTSNLLFSVTTLCTASLTLLSFLAARTSILIRFLSLFCFEWKVHLLGCSPLSAANQLSCTKIFVSNPSYLSPTVPRMEIDNEIVTDSPKLPASEANSCSLCCTTVLGYNARCILDT